MNNHFTFSISKSLDISINDSFLWVFAIPTSDEWEVKLRDESYDLGFLRRFYISFLITFTFSFYDSFFIYSVFSLSNFGSYLSFIWCYCVGWNQGCLRISSALGLYIGSTVNINLSRSIPSLLIELQIYWSNITCPLVICSISSSSFSLSKG